MKLSSKLLVFFLFSFFLKSSFAASIPQNKINKDSIFAVKDSIAKSKLDTVIDNSDYNAEVSEAAVKFAKKFIGVRYRHGGKSPRGFDCSGYTRYVMMHFGHTISPVSHEQAYYGKKIARENIKAGDILLFKSYNLKAKRIGHAALAVSNIDSVITFIHAAPSGIRLETLKSKFFDVRFVCARRIFTKADTLQKIVKSKDYAKDTAIVHLQNNYSKTDTTTAFYLVKEGDNLDSIAKKHNCSTKQLMDWNNLKSDKLVKGQKLNTFPVYKKKKTVATKTDNKAGNYIVKKGDTMWSISKKFNNVTVSDLKKWNNLTDKSILKIGQTLIIHQ
ncbi:MAG: LysM peptidoglycan-binding domain-containing protein [Bacteroidetes bacterium]|nr:LysM peptidoglycan-binding domain-containing protein [Bacteroidota bacterium]